MSAPTFAELLTAALSDGTFVKLTLSKPRRGQGPLDEVPTQAFCRLVDIRKAPHLSLLLRFPRKDITQNVPVAQATAAVVDLLATRFLNAHLFTTAGDWELRGHRDSPPHLARHAPTFAATGSRSHDRPKAWILDPLTAPYLRELGIVAQGGHVKSDKADKYKQLQAIVKLVDQAVRGTDLAGRDHLRVVDMGCGKAYLTFALYDYFRHHLGVAAEVIGADRNAELVALCNSIARKIGYEGLSFVVGDVGQVDVGAVDVLFALHACDTATDAALLQAVRGGASLVLAVPCCQKEVRPQLRAPLDERPLLKHDTFKDRYAQMLTDGLRSLLLESEGYHSQVIEFISDAHTHRNVMLIATRDAAGRAPDVRAARRAEADALMRRYAITRQHLADGLGAAPVTDPPALPPDGAPPNARSEAGSTE